ncbi:MAG TPA: DUF1778 domain-containing protein [Drouetiella sp.]
MLNDKSNKTEKFDIRLSPNEDAVIKQAAAIQRTSPTNFIRQQALVAAEAVIHDQNRLVVTDDQWAAIQQALSRPAKLLPNLRRKLAQSDEWDK